MPHFALREHLRESVRFGDIEIVRRPFVSLENVGVEDLVRTPLTLALLRRRIPLATMDDVAQ